MECQDIDPNYLIKIRLNISKYPNTQLTFLVDTGAAVSLLNVNSIRTDVQINTNDNISISGIGQFGIFTIGSIKADVILKDKPIQWDFQVIQGKFILGFDGILGGDFLKNRAFIDCIADKLYLFNDPKEEIIMFRP